MPRLPTKLAEIRKKKNHLAKRKEIEIEIDEEFCWHDEDFTSKVKNSMDLKQQLIIWKKTDFLLNNVAFTPKLCEELVDLDVCSLKTITDIQVK